MCCCAACNIGSVSYTHLDVYKRQLLATADLHIQKEEDAALLERIMKKAEEQSCSAVLIGGDLLEKMCIRDRACVIILMHRRENLIFQITQQLAGASLLPCFNAGNIGGDQRSAVHRHGQAGIHIRNRMSQPCNNSGFRVIISEGAEPGRAVAYPKADRIALFGCRRRNPDRL